jgi:transposase
VHYLLPWRRCHCGRTTTAVPPFGAAGRVVYGPNINAVVILLASEGNVPIERTAMLMGTLWDVPVSSGFVTAPWNASPSAWLRLALTTR